MLRLLCGRLAPIGMAALIFCTLPATGRTEPPRPQKIVFESFDKAELQGTWYPSASEGSKSPVAIFLHKFGGNRLQDGWELLAQQLQEKGIAVLSFDFRGHGDSTTIRPEFWQTTTNARQIKGAGPKKETLSYKDFGPAYMPMLVNDIAAAKLYVEMKNNARECNANDVFLVGAEEGAALGLLWAATEQRRHKRIYNQMGQLTFAPDPEGKDLATVVCLSLRANLGALKLPFTTVYASNPKLKEFPVCFFFGDEDTTAKAATNSIYDKILAADKNKALKLTYRIAVERTKLAGHELLGKKLGTEDLIVKYLGEKVPEVRAGKVWIERDVGAPGRPNINPLVQVQLSIVGINVP